MDNWKAYFHQPKPIEELIKSAIIVVDTNVLLSAYQWRDITVKEMIKTLKELSQNNRLRIPLQVIEEFSRNRAKEIVQRINDIESILSTLQPQKPLNQIVPILEGKESFNETNQIHNNFNEILKDYRKSLGNLRDELKQLFTYDPYLIDLYEIIDKSFYSPSESKSNEILIKEAQDRFKNKIPPGYKDSPKEDNSAGDYIIWQNLLQLKSNVIFVSGDKKPDWVYKDKQANSIGARRELIAEFYSETGGFDFAHLSPKEFITLLNPDVSDVVKDDLTKNISKKENDSKDFLHEFKVEEIQEILLAFDPLQVLQYIDLDSHSYFYYADALNIYELKQKDGTTNEFVDAIIDILLEDGTSEYKIEIADKVFSTMIKEIFRVLKK